MNRTQIQKNNSEFEILEEETEEVEQIDPNDLLLNYNRIAFQTNNFLLPQIYDSIKINERIKLRPVYQRRDRWDDKRKSKLIESLILNIPIPTIYLYETEQNIYEVMDGQQRLLAIVDFIENNLILTGLKILPNLNGKTVSKLSRRERSTMERASISTTLLLLESKFISETEDIDLRSIIFERLNTGSTTLNAQEIRNAINSETLYNKEIIKLSEFNIFTEIFNIPQQLEERKYNLLYSTMKDCEIVLRFFALKNEDNIRGSLKSMLDRELSKEISEDDLIEEIESFKSILYFLYELFDKNPFILNEKNGVVKRVAVNLYDSLMVAMHNLWEFKEEIKIDKIGVQKRLRAILEDVEGENYLYLTGKKTGAEAIRVRIKIAEKILMPKEE